jgi:hypothetical protein
MFYSPDINFKNWMRIYYEACRTRQGTDEPMPTYKTILMIIMFITLPILNAIAFEIFIYKL